MDRFMDTYSRSNILAPRSQEDLQMEDLQGAASVVERDADQGSRLSTSAVQPVVASIMDAARPLPSGTHLTENSVEQPGAEQGITVRNAHSAQKCAHKCTQVVRSALRNAHR